MFLGSLLKANYSKYKDIDLKKNNKSSNSISFNEILIVAQEDNLYQ